MRSLNVGAFIRSLTAMWENELLNLPTLGQAPECGSFDPFSQGGEKMTNLSVRPSEEELPHGHHPMDFGYDDNAPAALAAASAILVLRSWWLEGDWMEYEGGDMRAMYQDEVFESLQRDVESVIEELKAFRKRLKAVEAHTGDDMCQAAERVHDAKRRLRAEEAVHAAAVYRARILEELHEHPIETLARVAEGT